MGGALYAREAGVDLRGLDTYGTRRRQPPRARGRRLMGWRAIHDTINRSESLAGLSHVAERLFWRLLAGSDPYGRLAASPAKLRAHCWPLLAITDTEAGAALLELARAGRIHAYTVDGVSVVQLDAFDYHQPADLKRKRGKPQFPASPHNAAQGQERAVITICTIYNIPANGALPAQGQSTPAQGQHRVEKKREELQQQQHYVARANPSPLPPDVARAAAALSALGLELVVHVDDAARVVAWCELAKSEAKTNPAGFVRSGIESGAWPSPRSSPAENGSRPRRAIAEVVRDIIRNVGAELDPHAFAAEVAQLEARRGETIPRDLAEELVEEHRKVSQSQFSEEGGLDAA